MHDQLHTTTSIKRRAPTFHPPNRKLKPWHALRNAQLRVAVPDAAVRVVRAAELGAEGGHLEREAAGGAGDGVGGVARRGAAVTGE